jgi:hypothetical protein
MVGFGLLLIGGIAGLLKLKLPRIYNAVWYIRLDAFISFGLLGAAMYLKVKGLSWK